MIRARLPSKLLRQGMTVQNDGLHSMSERLAADDTCSVAALQVSYAIGVAQPLSVHVDTYGTGTIPDQEILAKVLDKFDFRPGACRFTSEGLDGMAELVHAMLVDFAAMPWPQANHSLQAAGEPVSNHPDHCVSVTNQLLPHQRCQ